MNDVAVPVAFVISAIEGFGDPATIARYAEITGLSIEHFGGRFVVSNAEIMIVEGATPLTRLSMIEFPSIVLAKAWYDSPQYAPAREMSPSAFTGRLLTFVEGAAIHAA